MGGRGVGICVGAGGPLDHSAPSGVGSGLSAPSANTTHLPAHVQLSRSGHHSL